MQNECNKTKGFVVPQIPQSHTLQTHANEFKGYANYSILPVRTKGRITMSTNKEIELNDTMYDCYTELEKAIFAIDNFLDIYDHRVEPTAEKAIKYGRSIGSERESCTLDDKISYKILHEYNNMMLFIRVARDYCNNAIEPIKKEFE